MPLSESQRLEFEEYLETILDLYSKDEYESDVENIVYHYCKRKFDIEREESVKLFYEIASPIKKWYSDIVIWLRICSLTLCISIWLKPCICRAFLFIGKPY